MLLAVLAPSLAAQSASGAEDEKVTFTVALTGEVDSLNPFVGVVGQSYELWALMYDTFTGYTMKDMSPAPHVATEWESSPDGKTWTFKMRDDVKYSDGKPLTSTDVAYTFNRVLDGSIAGQNWSTYLNNVTKVEAPDPTTVVLTLSKPSSVLPLLPIPIIPQHVWKNVSKKALKNFGNEPQDGKPVVGSGPFRLVEGETGGSTFRFERNPDYWGGAPHVDEVVFRVFKADDPAVQALIKGEVDYVNDIPALQVRALEEREGITAQNGLTPYFQEIAFNTGARDPETEKPLGDGNPALQDVKFRQALAYAVDKERIVRSAFQGAAEPGSVIVPPSYAGYRWEVPDEEAQTFDLDKANEMLDDAGYKRGADDKRTMPDGKPIGTLRLFARTSEKASVDIMDFFKEWLGELGIDAQVTAMDGNKLTEVILEGEYDAFQWGWYVEPDPDGVVSYFTCGQRGNLSDSWYCDKGYDAMYAQQGTEIDKAKRVEVIKQMQEQVYRDVPYIVVAYDLTGEALRTDRFACFQPQPDPDGVWLLQYGARNYTLLRPAEDAGDCDGVASAIGASESVAGGGDGDGDGGSNTGVIVGAAVLVVLLAGGAVLLMRRRGSAAERE